MVFMCRDSGGATVGLPHFPMGNLIVGAEAKPIPDGMPSTCGYFGYIAIVRQLRFISTLVLIF